MKCSIFLIDFSEITYTIYFKISVISLKSIKNTKHLIRVNNRSKIELKFDISISIVFDSFTGRYETAQFFRAQK